VTIDGFATPGWLGLLTVLAAVAAGYVWAQKQRRRHVLRFANLSTLERVAPRTPGWPRHVPPVLLWVGLILLTVALAGPMAWAQVPRNRATVMLVIDVSLSMQSTDVTPTRLAAAQAAATTFVKDLPATVNLGLESFAGTAAVLVSPTTDHETVTNAIDGLKLSESTATGEAIFAALQSIDSFSRSIPGDEAGPPPAQIVLMSDGKQTLPGPDGENEPRGAYTAARQAKSAKIPVSTIAFGTAGGTIDLSGRRVSVPVDEPTMRAIAELSGGSTFSARSEDQLREAYGKLRDQVGFETRQVDVSKAWFALGTLLSILSAAIALTRSQRLPA
jgi:Ca-activated chloride channel family protein